MWAVRISWTFSKEAQIFQDFDWFFTHWFQKFRDSLKMYSEPCRTSKMEFSSLKCSRLSVVKSIVAKKKKKKEKKHLWCFEYATAGTLISLKSFRFHTFFRFYWPKLYMKLGKFGCSCYRLGFWILKRTLFQ